MALQQKYLLTKMRHWIIIIVTVSSIYTDAPKYPDKQIITLLKQYFNKNNEGPTYMGQSIYKNNNNRVFRLEIGSSIKKINDDLLYSFKALAKIGVYANTPYKNFILLIHIDKYEVPVIARSKFKCCKAFFVDKTMTENMWRNECLILKGL